MRDVCVIVVVGGCAFVFDVQPSLRIFASSPGNGGNFRKISSV